MNWISNLSNYCQNCWSLFVWHHFTK